MLLFFLKRPALASLLLAFALSSVVGNEAAAGSERVDLYGDPLPDGAIARLGTIRFHDAFIGSLAFTPDGRALVSGGMGGLRVWDAATGKPIRDIGSERSFLDRRAPLSPDGRLVAVGNGNQPGSIYELATGRRVCRIGTSSPTWSPRCFSPDGKVLAATSGSAIGLFTAQGGRRRHILRGHGNQTTDVVFTPDGKTLLSAGLDGLVRYWDVATGNELRRLRDHPSGVAQFSLSPDGTRLVTLGMTRLPNEGGGEHWFASNRIRLWEVASGKQLARLDLPSRNKIRGHPTGVGFVTFTPDGKELLTSGPDNALQFWDPATGKEVRRLEDHAGSSCFAFSPDGKTLAVAEAHKVIRVRDLATGKDLVPTDGRKCGFEHAVFGPAGRTVATAGEDGTVRMWEAATGRELRQLGGAAVPLHALDFSADGRILSLFSNNGTFRAFEVATGRLRERLEVKPAARLLAAASGGQLWALGGNDKALLVIDAATGKTIREFKGLEQGVAGAAFTPDRRALLALGADWRLHEWDLATATHRDRLLTPSLERSFSAFFSPDGRLVVVSGLEDHFSVLDLPTGRELRHITRPPEESDHSLWALAFAPDGRSLAWCGAGDGSIWLAEVASGQVRRRFSGHRGRVATLAFAADGNALVSCGIDATALVWDLAGSSRRRALSAEELAACWRDLAGADAATAYQDMRALAGSPAQAVALLKARLRAVTAGDAKVVGKLVAGLNNPRYAEREKAAQALHKLGAAAEPALQRALAGLIPLETRRRIEQILGKLAGPDRRRELRAVEILERIATAEARQLLETLAGGAPDAWLTKETQASLERLTRRSSREP